MRRRPLALQIIDTVPGPRAFCGCVECWPAFVEAVHRWTAEEEPAPIAADASDPAWAAI